MTASRRTRVVLAVLAFATLVALGAGGWRSADAKNVGMRPLSQLAVPASPELEQFVRDTTSLERLGKALFWDMQAGSDGRTACASCHYSGGADNRSRNEVNPRGGTFQVKNPNEDLTTGDFPFHKLADPNDRNSAVLSDSANVSGSQGVLPSVFDGV